MACVMLAHGCGLHAAPSVQRLPCGASTGMLQQVGWRRHRRQVLSCDCGILHACTDCAKRIPNMGTVSSPLMPALRSTLALEAPAAVCPSVRWPVTQSRGSSSVRLRSDQQYTRWSVIT